ncbi:MAG: hypothetical protein FJ312_06665 [SAR202 cluster bacterium]|nr:hypothetical protein [SAR202 cluster bacterium]
MKRIAMLGLTALVLLAVSCSKGPPPAPTPTPTPTFTQQREVAVSFLRTTNQAMNDFSDSITDVSPVHDMFGQLDVLALSANINKLLTQLEGYSRRIDEIVAPLQVPETVQIKSSLVLEADKIQSALEAIRSPIQKGDQAELDAAVSRLAELSEDTDTATARVHRVTQELFTGFNIPDTEVNYRRPQ